MRSFPLTLSALLLSATAQLLPAQVNVVARGELADGQATGCYYCPGYQYVIKFVGTQLQSSTVNLNLFINQYVELTGTWNGTVLNVTSAQLTPETFSIGGNTSIGHTIRPTTMSTPGDLALNIAALGTTFLVPFADIALMMNPASAVILGAGITNGNGEFKSDIDLPNDPSIVGVRVFGQGIVFTPAGAIFSTNVDAKEVTP